MDGALGFIGTGTITAAMVRGLKTSSLRDRQVILSPRNAATAAELARTFDGVTVAHSNAAVAAACRDLVLAVRPQVAEAVLRDLQLGPDHRVVSLIAGLDHRTVAAWTGAGSVCRAIPLPFIATGRDMTPVYPPDPAALALFGALGGALPVAARPDFDTLATLSALMGSFFGLAEIAAGWAAGQGLPADQAQHYVARLFANLADALRANPLAAEALREEHSTRGGLNEQLFRDFRTLGGEAALRGALDAVMARVAGTRAG
jgi:pyrroline-5-carboxylate reductase